MLRAVLIATGSLFTIVAALTGLIIAALITLLIIASGGDDRGVEKRPKSPEIREAVQVTSREVISWE